MKTRLKQHTRLHFIGIGGIGMSGIAEVFHTQGYRVSGSDSAESETTKRLASLGLQVSIGHSKENVVGADVVVISSAIRPDNPELVEARRLRTIVIPRAESLGELMRGKTGLAVAGTHGKTTTTSLLATCLVEAGQDPTIVIGGKVDQLGGNAKLGAGQLVVAEADESDGSFLQLPATYAIITNIDSDHLDHFGSLAAIEDAFIGFVSKLPFYGRSVVCGDDPGVLRCLERFTKPYITYGFGESNMIRGELLGDRQGDRKFRVFSKNGTDWTTVGDFELTIPGKHNILNALGVVALCLELDFKPETIAKGLCSFVGVKRRLEVKFRRDKSITAPKTEKTPSLVIDDYGHHPTEIAATLDAVKGMPGVSRVLVVFQPHRYTRTLHCLQDFKWCFGKEDPVLISEIYPAGESPIEGVSSELLAEQVRGFGGQAQACGDLDATFNEVLSQVQDGDAILCLGAGSITRLSDRLADHYGSTRSK